MQARPVWVMMPAIVSLFSLFWTPPAPRQQRAAIPRASTRSPHGPLAMSCENCHTYTAWKPIRAIPEFDHNKTRYPLRGMHQGVACSQCHVKLVFTDVGKKCADCHADIHRRQLGNNCEQCHTVKGWRVSVQAIKDHQNRFPLIGAHATLDCESCHKNGAAGRFEGLSTDCISCHATDFATPNFDHRAMGFPATCTACHSMDSWLGAKFDHLRFTGFALTGMHATLDCTACHVGGKFKGTPATCFGCHAKDFNGTTNPPHVAAGFPHDCATCHTTAAWIPATFDHNTFTKFPLTGMHKTVPCLSCHVGGKFAGTPADCASCHMPDYNKTTNPNHKTAGFPTDCSICHSTAGWIPANFDHSRTGFPLTGAHTKLQCSSCHKNGVFTGLSPTCSSCHMADFKGTTNPNHVAAGFPTDCTVCHNTTAWIPASFDHSKTGWPLTGAHVNVPCTSCHINNAFAGTPTDCYSCHKAQYQATNDPNHVAAHFPTTCQTCHNTSSWAGASFNHTWFPIYSGTHAGKWSTCADCHVNASNFAVFSCVTCHTHSAANTTPNHTDVRGYTYTPTSCYSCHPTGQGGG